MSRTSAASVAKLVFSLVAFTIVANCSVELQSNENESSQLNYLDGTLRLKISQLLDNNAELVEKILNYLDTLPSTSLSRRIALAIFLDEPSGAHITRDQLESFHRHNYNFIKPVLESMLTEGLFSREKLPFSWCDCDANRLKTKSLTCCPSCCGRCFKRYECYEHQRCSSNGQNSNHSTSATAARLPVARCGGDRGQFWIKKLDVHGFQQETNANENVQSRYSSLSCKILEHGQIMRAVYAEKNGKREQLWRLFQQIPTYVDRRNYRLLIEILASLGEPLSAVHTAALVDGEIIPETVNALNIERILESESEKSQQPDDDELAPIGYRPILNNEGLLMVASNLIRRIRQLRAGCRPCPPPAVCHMDSECPKSCYPEAFACFPCLTECPAYPKDVSCSDESQTPIDEKEVHYDKNNHTGDKLHLINEIDMEPRRRANEEKTREKVVRQSVLIRQKRRTGERKKRSVEEEERLVGEPAGDKKEKQLLVDEKRGYVRQFNETCGLAPKNRLSSRAGKVSSYMVNGVRQKYGEWPSFVRLDVRWDLFTYSCGGTLISNRHVLTAAHCLYHQEQLSRVAEPEHIRVILGEHDLNSKDTHEKRLKVSNFCIASEYINNRKKMELDKKLSERADDPSAALEEKEIDEFDDSDEHEREDERKYHHGHQNQGKVDWKRAKSESESEEANVGREEEDDEYQNESGENKEVLAESEGQVSAGERRRKKRGIGSDKNYAVYDYAVLELEKEVEFNDFHQPACLPRRTFERKLQRSDLKCYLVGAGAKGFYPSGKGKDPTVVEKMRMKRVSCERYGFGRLDESRVCFTKADSVGDSCSGDSGGPILCLDPDRERWTLVALVSYGSRMCDGRSRVGWTGVYTRVTNLWPRIRKECDL